MTPNEFKEFVLVARECGVKAFRVGEVSAELGPKPIEALAELKPTKAYEEPRGPDGLTDAERAIYYAST